MFSFFFASDPLLLFLQFTLRSSRRELSWEPAFDPPIPLHFFFSGFCSSYSITFFSVAQADENFGGNSVDWPQSNDTSSGTPGPDHPGKMSENSMSQAVTATRSRRNEIMFPKKSAKPTEMKIDGRCLCGQPSQQALLPFGSVLPLSR